MMAYGNRHEHDENRSYTRRDALGLGSGALAALLGTTLLGCTAPHTAEDEALYESQHAPAQPEPEAEAPEPTPEPDISTLVYDEQTVPLERNGIGLHVVRTQVTGQVPERSILLVHGLTYSSHVFDINYEDYSLVRFLARLGYAVWRLDIAGYGESGELWNGYLPNSDYAAEDVAAAAELAVQTDGRERIDVLGWSWGTVVASHMTAWYPHLVNRLVLYAPILHGLGMVDYLDPFHYNTWEHAASDFQRREDGSFNDDISDPVLRDLYCASCWHYDGDTSPNGGRLDLCVDQSVVLIDLASIPTPTLVLCGDADPNLDFDAVNASLGLLPAGSALEIIPGGGHLVMYEKPFYHEFQQCLTTFLG